MSGDWRDRAETIKAARERINQRETDKAERKRRQNQDDLKALKRLDDRRDRKGRRK